MLHLFDPLDEEVGVYAKESSVQGRIVREVALDKLRLLF